LRSAEIAAFLEEHASLALWLDVWFYG